ncbi:Photosystem II PsbR [Artemisia annua]|uniref:Photosystem II 10 kDa polypeptide, chloroplastic n=1 Tax=Artemisia annua TaxID=35608 RepID=A0A2U1PTP4_ARTAN|nr:Photosystem II PsbR [Artemisia annua]
MATDLIKTDKPLGIGGGMALRDGKDASGRKPTGKGVYQFVDKYGTNVDGYSPIYNEEEWSPSGDVYVGVPSTIADLTSCICKESGNFDRVIRCQGAGL